METYIRRTIKEPFPYFYGHPAMQDRLKEGPFYAPNSEWFTPFTERALTHEYICAGNLRRQGYTVTIDIVKR